MTPCGFSWLMFCDSWDGLYGHSGSGILAIDHRTGEKLIGIFIFHMHRGFPSSKCRLLSYLHLVEVNVQI